MKQVQKVAVITGAANGIGFALAQACLKQNKHVVMADKDNTALFNRVKQLNGQFKSKVIGIPCDVSQIQSVRFLAEQTFSHFQRIDWLFNNAGIIGPLSPVWELSIQDIHTVMEVNLFGIIHCLHAFLPLLFKQTQPSHIINMASVFGLCSSSQMTTYAMSKHAILALSEALYFDLKQLEKPIIDVSVVCPSFVNTQLLHHSHADTQNKFHELVANLLSHSRSPTEIADYILREVEKKIFYILPDKEVKNYCEQRTQAIIQQTQPCAHNLEKIIASLSKRAVKS